MSLFGMGFTIIPFHNVHNPLPKPFETCIERNKNCEIQTQSRWI